MVKFLHRAYASVTRNGDPPDLEVCRLIAAVDENLTTVDRG
jgi:hypothetical protein